MTDTRDEPPVRWANEHTEEIYRYPGEWVAVGPRGILAHGPDFIAVAEAAQKLYPDPLFEKVPRPGLQAL